jgi:hypothetical protein
VDHEEWHPFFSWVRSDLDGPLRMGDEAQKEPRSKKDARDKKVWQAAYFRDSISQEHGQVGVARLLNYRCDPRPRT